MAYYTKDKPPNRAGPLKPDDYSDVGQAKVLVARYHDCLRYTKQTGYLCRPVICFTISIIGLKALSARKNACRS